MQTKKWLIGVIVILAVLWVAYVLMTKNSEAPVNTDEGAVADETVVGDTNDVSSTMPVPSTNTREMEVIGEETTPDQIVQNIVKYTDNGFEPSTLSIKKGESVTFTNNSSRGVWVASAFHPTHEVYPAFDQLKSVPNGGEYTFTFDKVGEWKYHNHVSASHFGTVIVK